MPKCRQRLSRSQHSRSCHLHCRVSLDYLRNNFLPLYWPRTTTCLQLDHSMHPLTSVWSRLMLFLPTGSLSESDSNVKSTFFSKQNMSTMPPASGTSGRNNGTSSINRNDRSDNSNTVNIRRGVPEYGSSSNNRYGNCQDPIVNMIDDARGMSIHGSNNQRTGFSMTTSSPPGSPMRSKMSLSDSAEWQQLEQQLQNGDDQDPFEMDT